MHLLSALSSGYGSYMDITLVLVSWNCRETELLPPSMDNLVVPIDEARAKLFGWYVFLFVDYTQHLTR